MIEDKSAFQCLAKANLKLQQCELTNQVASLKCCIFGSMKFPLCVTIPLPWHSKETLSVEAHQGNFIIKRHSLCKIHTYSEYFSPILQYILLCFRMTLTLMPLIIHLSISQYGNPVSLKLYLNTTKL